MGSKLQCQDVEEPGISSPDTLKVRVEIALGRWTEANRSIGSSEKPSYHKDGLSWFLLTEKKMALWSLCASWRAGISSRFRLHVSTSAQSFVSPISKGCVRMVVCAHSTDENHSIYIYIYICAHTCLSKAISHPTMNSSPSCQSFFAEDFPFCQLLPEEWVLRMTPRLGQTKRFKVADKPMAAYRKVQNWMDNNWHII